MKKFIFSLMTDRRGGPWVLPIKGALLLLSLFYGLGVTVVRGLYVSGVFSCFQSPKPVISVGNITVGGTGKTPLVIWLLQRLLEKGIKPAVLTRGYMAGTQAVSDEAAMMRELFAKVPVYAGADRQASIRKALAEGSVDVFICDDAFQHWSLKRDMDIVVIDAVNPFGNGCLLPRGILREPLSALKRASVFVLTKTDRAPDLNALKERLKHINPTALIVDSAHRPSALVRLKDGARIPLDNLKGAPVLGLCAIADPGSFEASLRALGARIEGMQTFMDHHAYTAEDMTRAAAAVSGRNIKYCVTTHKDAVKIRPFLSLWGDVDAVYLDVDLEIGPGKDEFLKKTLAYTGR